MSGSNNKFPPLSEDEEKMFRGQVDYMDYLAKQIDHRVDLTGIALQIIIMNQIMRNFGDLMQAVRADIKDLKDTLQKEQKRIIVPR